MPNQDFIATGKLDKNQIITVPINNNTIEIPKEKWAQFLNDFSKRRFGWGTKVEVLVESIGNQILSEGLILNGITHESKENSCLVEISLGEDADNHQTHTISEPISIAYFVETESHLGVLEITEANNTKTRISLTNPMPVFAGYGFYENASAIT
ncbi:MAG TPA: DUF5335 family protein [Pyrinomonadaceae bacterium]|nr:DUF5335 family protein [Pyrinomonadaceae bacterium]